MRNNQYNNMHGHHLGVTPRRGGVGGYNRYGGRGGGWRAGEQQVFYNISEERREEFRLHRWELYPYPPPGSIRTFRTHTLPRDASRGSISNCIDGASTQPQIVASLSSRSDSQQTNCDVMDVGMSEPRVVVGVQDTELVNEISNKDMSTVDDDTPTTQGNGGVAAERDTGVDADTEMGDAEMELEEELFRRVQNGTSSADNLGGRKNSSEAAATPGYVLGDKSPQPLQKVALKNLTNSFGQHNKRRVTEEVNREDDGKKTKHNGEGEYQLDCSISNYQKREAVLTNRDTKGITQPEQGTDLGIPLVNGSTTQEMYKASNAGLVHPCFSLPDGWTCKTLYRKSGKQVGSKYYHYLSPGNNKFDSMKKCNQFIEILGQPGIEGNEADAMKVFKERYQTRKATQKVPNQNMAQTTEEVTAQLTNHPQPEATKEPPLGTPNSNHNSQNMMAVDEESTDALDQADNKDQSNLCDMIIPIRQSAKDKVCYKDMDDASISRMMSVDDAAAIEKAEKAKASHKKKDSSTNEVEDSPTQEFENGTKLLKLFHIEGEGTGEIVEIKPVPGRIRSFDENTKLYTVDFENKEVQKLSKDAVQQAVLYLMQEKEKNKRREEKKNKKKNKKSKNGTSLAPSAPSYSEKGTLFYQEKKKGLRKFVIQGELTREGTYQPKKFKLVHELSTDEHPTVLPDKAIFKGSFDEQNTQVEESVKLSFKREPLDSTLYYVDGKGKNRYGVFEMHGTAQKRYPDGRYVVKFNKKYTHLSHVSSKNGDDTNGIASNDRKGNDVNRNPFSPHNKRV